MKKIILVIANSRWDGQMPWQNINPSVPIITAVLKNKIDFMVLDANGDDYSEEKTCAFIKNYDADIVLIPALAVQYHRQYHKVAELAKEARPQAIVVMGGVYPTTMKEKVLKDENVDYIFMGHAEERLDVFLSLLCKAENIDWQDFAGIGYRNSLGEIYINSVKSYIADVQHFAKPDYSKLNLNNYIAHVPERISAAHNYHERNVHLITSYGCPYNCLFCATRTISGREVAFRPLADILEEIDFFVRDYAVNVITFMDDCILADRARAMNLFQEIIKRKYNIKWRLLNVAAWHLDEEILTLMQQAGCEQIGISVESGCDRVLHEIIRKPLKKELVPPLVTLCRKLGITMTSSFVIGFPGETWDEIRESLLFAESCNFDLINIYIATVLPETDLYKIAVAQNLLPADFDFYNSNNFGYGVGNITTNEFTPQELQVLRAYEWDRINFSTVEKRIRAAKIMGINLEELAEHRKQTRIKFGVHF